MLWLSEYIIIPLVALAGSALTFFSGFGLGTLLLPAFGLFFPVETSIALTAVVHFLNNVFKATLIGRHAEWPIVLRFGTASLLASFGGAWLLMTMSKGAPLAEYQLGFIHATITLLKIVVAVLLIGFVCMEIIPALSLNLRGNHLIAGGLLSGFFGGLTGMQGALRSAFLVHADLGKEAFIATGVIIACLVDTARIAVYSERLGPAYDAGRWPLLAVACLAAFAGAFAGSRLLKKTTYTAVQRIVAMLLGVFAILLGAGIL